MNIPARRSPARCIPWVAGGITLVWLSISHTGDFHVYWIAGRALASGWDAVYRISGLTPFKYHPFFALTFAPFGWLAETPARVVWAVLNAAIVVDTQRRWLRAWKLDEIAIGLAFICIGHALFWQYQFGNVTFVMLWLWTVALTSPRVWIEAGCYALLIALKPFWIALVVPWILLRRWQLIVRVVAMVGAISLVPIVLGPRSLVVAYQRWVATFADPLHAHNYPKTDNQSWFGFLYRHGDLLAGGVTLWWVIGCSAVGVLWLWFWRRIWRDPLPRAEWWLVEASLIPFILWTSPLSWIHHQILLWPLLALAWKLGRHEPVARVVFVVALIVLTILSQSIIGRSATLVILRWGIPLIAFPLLTWWVGARLAPGGSLLEDQEQRIA
ncbi:MAG TPA: glycosyltransferase family 87 protein [Gemmatimonadales bacterium]